MCKCKCMHSNMLRCLKAASISTVHHSQLMRRPNRTHITSSIYYIFSSYFFALPHAWSRSIVFSLQWPSCSTRGIQREGHFMWRVWHVRAMRVDVWCVAWNNLDAEFLALSAELGNELNRAQCFFFQFKKMASESIRVKRQETTYFKIIIIIIYYIRH